MSRRLAKDELSRGTLKLVKIQGWPLRRQIRIVQGKEAFAFKAVQHFLRLARNKIPEIRVLEAAQEVPRDRANSVRCGLQTSTDV
jgi:hypothetical protein